MRMADTMIYISARAARRIQRQLGADAADAALRIAAQRRENGDFHYAMGFDRARRDGDCRDTVARIPVVVDAQSLPLVRGMTVDFVELAPGEERFIFLNPNDPAYVPPADAPGA